MASLFHSAVTYRETLVRCIIISFAIGTPLFFIVGFIFAIRVPRDEKRCQVYLYLPLLYVIYSCVVNILVSLIYGSALYFLYSTCIIYDLNELDGGIVTVWLVVYLAISVIINVLRV